MTSEFRELRRSARERVNRAADLPGFFAGSGMAFYKKGCLGRITCRQPLRYCKTNNTLYEISYRTFATAILCSPPPITKKSIAVSGTYHCACQTILDDLGSVPAPAL